MDTSRNGALTYPLEAVFRDAVGCQNFPMQHSNTPFHERPTLRSERESIGCAGLIL